MGLLSTRCLVDYLVAMHTVLSSYMRQQTRCYFPRDSLPVLAVSWEYMLPFASPRIGPFLKSLLGPFAMYERSPCSSDLLGPLANDILPPFPNRSTFGPFQVT